MTKDDKKDEAAGLQAKTGAKEPDAVKDVQAEAKTQAREKGAHEYSRTLDRDRKVRIIVHPKGEHDSPYADVGVNFKVFRIRKGEAAVVPETVYKVLRDAVERHVRSVEENGQTVQKPVDIPRFTVENLGYVEPGATA